MATSDLESTITSRIEQVLSAAGFKRHRFGFERKVGNVLHLVALQSSQSSTASRLRTTINLAVWAPDLAEPNAKPDIWSAQWRERIGKLMPQAQDHWWTVSSLKEAEQAAQQISEALVGPGLSALDRISSTSDLLQLWETGHSPGLTQMQAAKYANKLRGDAV
jgi:hypothetical protein